MSNSTHLSVLPSTILLVVLCTNVCIEFVYSSMSTVLNY